MSVYPSAPGGLTWVTSRLCESGACVQVARNGESVIFGNTADPGGPVYGYSIPEWEEFVAGVKRGDFDTLV